MPWFEFTHRQPSPLFCGSQVLYSSQGTQQGDPLGPAFFALAIQHVISSVEPSEEVRWQVWYLNDGVLVGDPCVLLRLLESLTAKFAQLGLRVNLSKCRLWSPNGLNSFDAPISLVDWDIPKKVLGTPFGSEEAIAQFLQDTRSKHHKFAVMPFEAP